MVEKENNSKNIKKFLNKSVNDDKIIKLNFSQYCNQDFWDDCKDLNSSLK